jgi:methyl-accepting chemotaxis protein
MQSTGSRLLAKFKISRLMLALSTTIILFTLLSGGFLAVKLYRDIIVMEHQTLIQQVEGLGQLLAAQPSDAENAKKLLHPTRWNSDRSGYAVLVDGPTADYIVFPPDPSREGGPMTQLIIDEGGTIKQAIQQVSRSATPRMIHYSYVKPGGTKPIPKATYLYPLQKGGSVLIVGTYLEKADELFLHVQIYMACALVFLLILMAGATLWVTRHIVERVACIDDGLSRVAKGDLFRPTELQGSDEFAHLAKSLNISQQNLARVIMQQITSSGDVAKTSIQVDEHVNDAHQLIRNELDMLDQLASAMDEMASSVTEVAHNASMASENAQSTDARTSTGTQRIRQCIASIEKLCAQLQQGSQSVTRVQNGIVSINSIIETIQGISEQTNLLALNAAIEAARAGESGRGFAVVADEVRQLASRTQSATGEIESMINNLRNQATDAVELVDQSVCFAEQGMEEARLAGDEFAAITTHVSELTDINHQIATAAEEQSQVAQTMSMNVNHLHMKLRDTNSAADQIAVASHSLKQQSTSLKNQLDHFQITDPTSSQSAWSDHPKFALETH